MATKAPFLNQRYGAYNHRDVPEPDEELARIGPGTPCGEYMRRFWNPVLLAEDLKDLPVAVKIMDEELVVFRDKSGRVGVMELHCPHRGTSLEYGQVENEGIRCCYHGWLIRSDGAILDTPGEPPESTFKDRLCHGAYPVKEYKGLIFAYMGPPDKMPEFPNYDSFDVSGFDEIAVRHTWPCNWLQLKDNCMDPAHTAFLHTIEMGHGFSEAHKTFGTLDWMETPIGSAYIHCRRVGDNIFLRMAEFICPNIHHFATNAEDGSQVHSFSPAPSYLIWLTPVDDTLSYTFGIRRYPAGLTRPGKSGGLGQDGDRPYHDRQRVPGDWDAQVSQRPIAVHAMERLGTTDRGVLLLRRTVREGIRAVQRGEDPKGVIRAADGPIPTYANNTVLAIPPAENHEADLRLLREVGRRVGGGYITDPSTRYPA